jgi:hypothetical protein
MNAARVVGVPKCKHLRIGWAALAHCTGRLLVAKWQPATVGEYGAVIEDIKAIAQI